MKKYSFILWMIIFSFLIYPTLCKAQVGIEEDPRAEERFIASRNAPQLFGEWITVADSVGHFSITLGPLYLYLEYNTSEESAQFPPGLIFAFRKLEKSKVKIGDELRRLVRECQTKGLITLAEAQQIYEGWAYYSNLVGYSQWENPNGAFGTGTYTTMATGYIHASSLITHGKKFLEFLYDLENLANAPRWVEPHSSSPKRPEEPKSIGSPSNHRMTPSQDSVPKEISEPLQSLLSCLETLNPQNLDGTSTFTLPSSEQLKALQSLAEKLLEGHEVRPLVQKQLTQLLCDHYDIIDSLTQNIPRLKRNISNSKRDLETIATSPEAISMASGFMQIWQEKLNKELLEVEVKIETLKRTCQNLLFNFSLLAQGELSSQNIKTDDLRPIEPPSFQKLSGSITGLVGDVNQVIANAIDPKDASVSPPSKPRRSIKEVLKKFLSKGERTRDAASTDSDIEARSQAMAKRYIDAVTQQKREGLTLTTVSDIFRETAQKEGLEGPLTERLLQEHSLLEALERASQENCSPETLARLIATHLRKK